MMCPRILAFFLVLSAAVPCVAGEADIIEVKATKIAENTYRFSVTVLHKDDGWKHYADKWDIVAPDGQVLGTRILHHPMWTSNLLHEAFPG